MNPPRGFWGVPSPLPPFSRLFWGGKRGQERQGRVRGCFCPVQHQISVLRGGKPCGGVGGGSETCDRTLAWFIIYLYLFTIIMNCINLNTNPPSTFSLRGILWFRAGSHHGRVIPPMSAAKAPSPRARPRFLATKYRQNPKYFLDIRKNPGVSPGSHSRGSPAPQRTRTRVAQPTVGRCGAEDGGMLPAGGVGPGMGGPGAGLSEGRSEWVHVRVPVPAPPWRVTSRR